MNGNANENQVLGQHIPRGVPNQVLLAGMTLSGFQAYGSTSSSQWRMPTAYSGAHEVVRIQTMALDYTNPSIYESSDGPALDAYPTSIPQALRSYGLPLAAQEDGFNQCVSI